MKATFPWAAALLAAGLTASLANAQYPQYPQYCSPVFKMPLCVGPDACWGGFYTVCPNGTAFGPNYNVRPPFPPFNGMLPPAGQKVMAEKLGIPYPQQPGMPIPPAVFPYHHYVRSPRDFFMWRENMEDQLRREQRPGLVP